MNMYSSCPALGGPIPALPRDLLSEHLLAYVRVWADTTRYYEATS